MQEENTFRVDSKTWFLTYPQCPLPKEQAKELIISKGKAIIGGVVAREVHQDGSPHLHAYLQLEKQFSCKNPLFWDLSGYHGNYQKARCPKEALAYVKKDKDYIEWGDLDVEAKHKSLLEHSQYLGKRMQSESLHLIAQDHPEVMLNYEKYRRNILAYKQDSLQPLTTADTRGIWIYGPPGVGKTHYVHLQETDLYIKAANKWWDGYTGQKAVLIDDLDSDCLAHYLKLWADKYATTGEVKGGHVPLVYERLYITSNFSILQLFRNLPEVTIEAIHRRFDIHHFVDRSLGLKRLLPN